MLEGRAATSLRSRPRKRSADEDVGIGACKPGVLNAELRRLRVDGSGNECEEMLMAQRRESGLL